MSRQLTPEEICPGDEYGFNKGKRHSGVKRCWHCEAKAKPRKRSPEWVLTSEHSWTSPSFRPLERGCLIKPGEEKDLGGLKIVNTSNAKVWIEKIAYGSGREQTEKVSHD